MVQAKLENGNKVSPRRKRSPRLLDRAVSNLLHTWRDLTGRVGRLAHLEVWPDDNGALDAADMRRRLRDCLEQRGGEVSARARAAGLGRQYLLLSPADRKVFLSLLARDFDVDAAALDQAIQHFRSTDEPATVARRRLRAALRPPRVQLLRQFNTLQSGVKFLVDMRADLLAMPDPDPALRDLEYDLRELLESWFDIGFLELCRINWDSPAALLEKLGNYEAVHRLRGWRDMKNRLDADRRCFAYFHPSMPGEPLIFVEVALVSGLADNIQSLLDERAPLERATEADTAIFFSISKTQKGLAGINFGSFLIKRVVDALQQELANIKTFATLSPIPGFVSWFRRNGARDIGRILQPAEGKKLASLFPNAGSPAERVECLTKAEWLNKKSLSEALHPILLKLCAHYLLVVKHPRKARAALDPVAHFHISNGARVERINWMADTSRKGIAGSLGMMVNYGYRLGRIEANHEAYMEQGKIAVSRTLRSQL